MTGHLALGQALTVKERLAINKGDRIGDPSEIFFARRKALGRTAAFVGEKLPI
jgi:hypothetical protein